MLKMKRIKNKAYKLYNGRSTMKKPTNEKTEQKTTAKLLAEDLKNLDEKLLFISSELPFVLNVLDKLLDALTLLEVCKDEYKDYTEDLQDYNFNYNYLDKIIDELEEYNIKVILPTLLAKGKSKKL
jgi:hypothetical protein